LIREYNPFARIGKPLIEKTIIQIAGGDSRTKNRYFEQMKLLDFIREERGEVFSLNWKKVDYAQTSLHESLIEVSEDEPP